MLMQLAKGLRARAAIFIAVLYGICALAPALVVSVSPAAAAHCLTEGHQHGAQSAAHTHDAGNAHVHDDGAQHEHGNASDDQHADAEQCCGIFCVSALPAANHLPLGQTIHGPAVMPVIFDHLASRGPDRINRPPIASLSL